MPSGSPFATESAFSMTGSPCWRLVSGHSLADFWEQNCSIFWFRSPTSWRCSRLPVLTGTRFPPCPDGVFQADANRWVIGDTVAAACKETADSPECMGKRNGRRDAAEIDPIGQLKNAIGTAPTDIPLFPVQLLESGMDFLLAGLLQLCFRKRTRKTDVIPFYCIGYACIRLFTERFRYDLRRYAQASNDNLLR